MLRTSNNRAQQKKMMFLERNLEQLTVVQRQLVEQNSSLKKEVAIAERKLIARNERIQSLESLLQDSQEKLTAANHRYVTLLPCLLKDFLNLLTRPAVSKPNLQPSKSVSKPQRQGLLAVSAHPPPAHLLLSVAASVPGSQSPYVVAAARYKTDLYCRSLVICRSRTVTVRTRRRGRAGSSISGRLSTLDDFRNG